MHATAARRDGQDYVLTLEGGRELRGDRLLVATGGRPRIPEGLDTVGVTAGRAGIGVDALKALRSKIMGRREIAGQGPAPHG